MRGTDPSAGLTERKASSSWSWPDFVPAIHFFVVHRYCKDVDARHKLGMAKDLILPGLTGNQRFFFFPKIAFQLSL